MDVDRIKWSGPHPYCTAHQSHYCPCLKPDSYDPLDAKHQEYIRGWEAIAPIVVFLNDEPPPEPEPEPWWVRLNETQARIATEEGQRREAADVGLAHVSHDPGPETSLAQSIRACKGEAGVSLMLGLPWTGKGQEGMRRADVGDWYEVRSVEVTWKGLVIRPKDRPDNNRPFILTDVSGDDVLARGWRWSRDVAVDENLQNASRYSTKKWWLTHKLDDMRDLPPLPQERR